MTKLSEKWNEGNLNAVARILLRMFAVIVILFYVIWRVAIPLVQKERVILDQNDGYVLLGCIALLLAIEGVKAFVVRFLKRN